MNEKIIIALILWPCLSAVFCFTIGRKHSRIRNNVADIMIGMEIVLYLLAVWGFYKEGMAMELVLPNVCGLGVSFRLDEFRILYSGIAIYMWFMSTIFSKEYFKHHQNRNRYYFFLLFTLGATIGVFLSNDFFTLYIFFELMSLASYVWVVQEETKEAIRAGETYMAIAIIGGMVLLMGLFLLYYEAGSLDFTTIHRLFLEKRNATVFVEGSCMLFGFGAKAGMFPLHIWLPKSHPVAPAPASALLSGILTKTGIYGVLLLCLSVFFEDKLFATIVLFLGSLTMLVGAILAVFSIDLKRIFACSSVSQIGFILVGCSMIGILGKENGLAVQGTVLHMVNHSLFKLTLFLIAGAIYQNTHQLDLNQIEGFGYGKPFLKICYTVAGLGISGIPLFSGYVSKTLLHESIVEGSVIMAETELGILLSIVEWLFLITGGLTFAYILKAGVAIFYERGKQPWEKGPYLNPMGRIAIGVTTFLLLCMGLLPKIMMDPIAEYVKGFFYEKEFHPIAYFSFGNLKGAMISIAIGLLVYFFFIRKRLMKKGEEGYQYFDCWPKWLDLENSLYRPVLLSFLPFIMAFLCRILSRITDGFVVFLHQTVLKPAKTRQYVPIGSKFTDFLGRMVDEVVVGLNKTICKKKPIKKSFVELFAFARIEAKRTNRLVGRSVSFGLLMACVGLMITLVYLLMTM